MTAPPRAGEESRTHGFCGSTPGKGCGMGFTDRYQLSEQPLRGKMKDRVIRTLRSCLTGRLLYEKVRYRPKATIEADRKEVRDKMGYLTCKAWQIHEGGLRHPPGPPFLLAMFRPPLLRALHSSWKATDGSNPNSIKMYSFRQARLSLTVTFDCPGSQAASRDKGLG